MNLIMRRNGIWFALGWSFIDNWGMSSDANSRFELEDHGVL